MQQATFVICAFLSISYGARVYINGWSPRVRWWLNDARSDINVDRPATQWKPRQRYILDLLLQVHKPLLQQELIEMGRKLNDKPSDYVEDSWLLLTDFMECLQQGRFLRPYSIYSQLHDELPRQLLGVYRFLELAKDWNTFQRNACYARIHFNSVLFVNALQLAISKRADTKDLLLPAMHEVLPQLYFDKEVIMEAQLVNWQQLAPIPTKATKRSWSDTLASIVYPRTLKQPMQEPLISAEPVVIEVKPQRMQFSLDVELNSFWNKLINGLIIETHGQDTVLINADVNTWATRSSSQIENGKLLWHYIKQFVALLKLEELATGHKFLELIEPSLMTTGGVPYKSTNITAQTVSQLIGQSIKEMKRNIDNQLATELAEMQTMCIVGRVIANLYLLLCRHLSWAINGYQKMEPNLLGMATSNLRDPIYRMLLLQLAELIEQYERPNELLSDEQGLKIRNIHMGVLQTFEQVVDSDLINLMDQQLLQTQRNNLQLLQRRLVARQRRLNHKSFNITFELYAPEAKEVLIRSYLVPPGQDQQRYLLDSFVSELFEGENKLQRQFPMDRKTHTLSDLYKAKEPLNATNAWTFPQHLLLPRGTAEGLKLQLIVEILPWLVTEPHVECKWVDGIVSSTASVLAKAGLDVVVHHQGDRE